jgi:hypothetical protein
MKVDRGYTGNVSLAAHPLNYSIAARNTRPREVEEQWQRGTADVATLTRIHHGHLVIKMLSTVFRLGLSGGSRMARKVTRLSPEEIAFIATPSVRYQTFKGQGLQIQVIANRV